MNKLLGFWKFWTGAPQNFLNVKTFLVFRHLIFFEEHNVRVLSMRNFSWCWISKLSNGNRVIFLDGKTFVSQTWAPTVWKFLGHTHTIPPFIEYFLRYLKIQNIFLYAFCTLKNDETFQRVLKILELFFSFSLIHCIWNDTNINQIGWKVDFWHNFMCCRYTRERRFSLKA